MQDVNVTPKRMRRRTSILPSTLLTASTSNNQNPVEQLDENEKLTKYIQYVEEEKRNWNQYENKLKAEYSRLRKGLPINSDEKEATSNYMDYLEDNEKQFLCELKLIQNECKNFQNDVHLVEENYALLIPAMKNQQKRLRKFLNDKKEQCLKIKQAMASSAEF